MSTQAIVNAMANIPTSLIVLHAHGDPHWSTPDGSRTFPLTTNVTSQIQIDEPDGPVTIGRIDVSA